tara:strand:+ start:135 stop:590 length:456 start_codon:yes stop_codon:yes gene_type:complete
MKRGISPLISSVLLIAFVIALFVMISSFVSQEAGDAIEGSKGKVAGIVECSTASLDIVSACGDTSSVTLTVDNDGDQFITGVTIRVVGEDNVAVENVGSLNVAPFARVLNAQNYDISASAVGAISSIEVIPEVESGTCSGVLERESSISAC